ncbi:MAG: glycosyltransferase family 2 protein [Clostridia bacterium]|nr:glycosyltransferase family 2 protein [Clostridia bacterium]
MDKISVIVPCFNEEEVLPLFFEEIVKVISSMKECVFEVLFVNDGSSDGTLKVLKEFSKKDDRMKFISFSRNFGKEAAIYAGLKEATGDFVVLTDADLQDPPTLIPEMYRSLTEGEVDCVATRRVTRKGEPVLRSFFARMFYRIINRLAKINIVDGARDFRMMKRSMVNAILEVSEVNRFSKGIFSWVGFETKWIPYENVNRAAGKTKWSFFSLLQYSIEGIVGYSTMPLTFAALLGILFCFISLILICVIIVRTLVWGDSTAGWPSLACIIFFIGGIQLFCIGILGEYLAKTYLETKKRPIYVVKEKSE